MQNYKTIVLQTGCAQRKKVARGQISAECRVPVNMSVSIFANANLILYKINERFSKV